MWVADKLLAMSILQKRFERAIKESVECWAGSNSCQAD